MGRKADPRGKDRPRTIVLGGDVAEIAQKLADRGELSSTLTELLRFNYGFGDQIEEKKRELDATTEEIKLLQERSEHIIANINALEEQMVHNNATIRPALERRQTILRERLQKTHEKLKRVFDPQEESRLHRVALEIQDQLAKVKDELEELQ